MSQDLQDLIEDYAETDSENLADKVEAIVSVYDPEEIALFLESLPLEQRLECWNNIETGQQLEILLVMRGDPREAIIDSMSLESLDGIFRDINAEKLVELSESMPGRLVERAFNAMDQQQQKYFEGAQQYDNKSAGHWVDHNVLLLPPNAKVRDALRILRRETPDFSDLIYLVSRSGHLTGVVEVKEVIRALEHISIADLVDKEIESLNGEEDAYKAAQRVQVARVSALPVVSENNQFLGRINIYTACEIVNQDYESKLMASAGLDENEDLFAPVIKSAKSRMIWLGINLITAFLASWFIGLFEATLQEVVALAVLMPVVASMGGIAGSQTLTLIIRGLALGQVSKSNFYPLLKKELSVGALNGVVWAIVIGITAYFWFDSYMIGAVIACAILINISAAALSGVFVPAALDKLKLDPALSGSVILTTVTDIVGFVAFLGLGSLLLM
ncbi:magnesium transporter [Aliikangiella sp. G2MR2-5]|uniref:magnesium transporter n=1 Tax=Aliikangiella sp. G2MR2-5 TaxID=2788943 RepID=UPI0018AB7C47|nr:magnesium transporter [Aliikangiella sp. G2MR2-5]